MKFRDTLKISREGHGDGSLVPIFGKTAGHGDGSDFSFRDLLAEIKLDIYPILFPKSIEN